MYKIYLSPSTQDKSFGIDEYGMEAYRMNQIADIVEKRLIETNDFVIYRNKPQMQKLEIIDDSNQKELDLHLAIHSNYGTKKGVECYVKVGDERSNGVAKEIYKKLQEIYYDNTIDNGLQYNENILEIMKVKTSGVLVEIGCHDDKQDANWIINNIKSIGEAIAEGIIKGMKLKLC